jgi:hypothetical protein
MWSAGFSHCFGGGDFRDIIDALTERGVWPRLR